MSVPTNQKSKLKLRFEELIIWQFEIKVMVLEIFKEIIGTKYFYYLAFKNNWKNIIYNSLFKI